MQPLSRGQHGYAIYLPFLHFSLRSLVSSLLPTPSPFSMCLHEPLGEKREKKRKTKKKGWDGIDVVTVCPGGAVGYIRAPGPSRAAVTQHKDVHVASSLRLYCLSCPFTRNPISVFIILFPVIILSLLMLLFFFNHSFHSPCIQHHRPPSLPFFLSLLLPANNDGQRPSLVLTGLDNLGFAISIVTRVSPLPAEPNNWICAFFNAHWVLRLAQRRIHCKHRFPQPLDHHCDHDFVNRD